MAIYLESLSSMVHFPFNHVKELELSHNLLCQIASKLGADFFLQWFEIYGYTHFEMRRMLDCKFFVTLKLWSDKVSCDQLPSYNLIDKITAQT